MDRGAGAGSPVERVLHFLVLSHAWLALGAGLQVAFTMNLVPLPEASPRQPFVAGLATFAAYGFMRLVRIGDASSGAGHLAWIERHRVLIWSVSLFSALGAAVLFAPWIPEAWGLLIVLVPAVLLYILPYRTGHARGLRYVPFLKLFLIAGVWSGVVVALPFVAAGASALPLFIPMLIERAFFVLAITLPFDIRDLHYDPDRERTLARALGLRASKVLALTALLLSLFIVLLICSSHGMVGGALGVLFGYALTSMLIIRSMPGDSLVFYGLMLDGTLLLVPISWWLGEFLVDLALA